MTTPETGGAPPQNPPTPAPESTPNPNPAPPAAPSAPEWVGQHVQDATLAKHPSVLKHKDVGTLAQSYVALEKDYHNRVAIPDGKDPKATEQFWSKVGVPAGPEGYKFDQPQYPEGFPEEGKVGAGEMKEFAALAHANHVPLAAAQAIVKWAVDQRLAAASNAQMDRGKQKQVYTKELQTAWGAAYELNVSFADRVFDTFADDNFKERVVAKGWNLDPGFAQMMARVGRALGESDLLVGERPGGMTPDALQSELKQVQDNKLFWAYNSPDERKEHDRLVARAYQIRQLLYPEKA